MTATAPSGTPDLTDDEARTLADLIGRVEKATGPDIRLDFLIDDALYGNRTGVVPAVTESLDAVVALVERELPGCYWEARRAGGNGLATVAWAVPCEDDRMEMKRFRSQHKTPALALLLAFLRAKEQSR